MLRLTSWTISRKKQVLMNTLKLGVMNKKHLVEHFTAGQLASNQQEDVK